MEYIFWNDSLDTGIDVIDEQHKKIVEYINNLKVAHDKGEREAVSKIIDDVIGYTQQHFGFEEALMADAGYAQLAAHGAVHNLFIRRVGEISTRFGKGEDVTEELHGLLSRWLIAHIQVEDRRYVDAVKQQMIASMANQQTRKGLLARFFGN